MIDDIKPVTALSYSSVMNYKDLKKVLGYFGDEPSKKLVSFDKLSPVMNRKQRRIRYRLEKP